MTNSVPIFRALIIYAVCLPLAILMGYMLASPTDMANFGFVGVVLMLMTIPLFLKWHYPWLIACWNSVAGLYFLPGNVSLTWVLIIASFGISFVSYIMNRNLKFISVPSINRPIIFLLTVVLVTAKFTGGFGLSALGGSSAGGKHYLFIIVGVLGYFALTAHKIPLKKAGLYVNLFFLGALTAAVGNLVTVVDPSLYFIFWIFPADFGGIDNTTAASASAFITRLGGVCVGAVAMIYVLLARYGVIGILDTRKIWRPLLFLACFVLSFYGGFRSKVIEVGLIFGVAFYLEGLMRSKYLPMFLLMFVLGSALVVPFANKLPSTVQRSLTFLPLDLDMDVQMNANSSVDWRLQMWEKLIPQIPKYFWLGKGYSIDARDLELQIEGLNAGGSDSDGSALAGDYHNGPLSVIIPFGIFGVIGFLWLLVACFRVLHDNFRHGEAELINYNRFLYACYIVHVILFFTVIGSLYNDVFVFLGLAGLSIALNGGQCRRQVMVEKTRTYEKVRFAAVAR